MRKIKRIIFISSRQNELQSERDMIRDLINSNDQILPKLFIAKTFESDLSGRKESVNHMTEEWVLKSDIYLAIFDREYSEATITEYKTALNDKQVPKEIIIFVREREDKERDPQLLKVLKEIVHPKKGHSCILFKNEEELLEKTKRVLLNYHIRKTEGFILSKDILGPNLEGARNTDFPEKMRRKLLQPFGRYAIWKGRKGIPEYYIYDWDGQKIDVTWDYIEPHASDEIKEFYRNRYRKPFDT